MKTRTRETLINTHSSAPRGSGRHLLSIGISVLLSVSTFLTAISLTETIVYADNNKSITGLCTGAISNPTSGAGGWSYVYYGTYNNNPVKYRVLDKAATEFGGNTMLLDCNNTLLTRRFDDDSKVWADSEIKSWLNGNDFLNNDNVFTLPERTAIASSTKENPSMYDGDGNGYYAEDLLDWTPLNNEKIFLLDAKEATRLSYGYANTTSGESDSNKSKTGAKVWWWLRSPDREEAVDLAADVSKDGLILSTNVYHNNGVSPAFNIDLSSVIFSSVTSGTAGSAGTEYKLTIVDSGLGITPGSVTRSGTTITVPYTITGANKDNATQVSVLITDSPYSAGEAKTRGFTYLKLDVDTWGTAGSGTFTLPAACAEKTCGTDYYAYILAEDVNTGNATDYASTPKEITISESKPTSRPRTKNRGGDDTKEPAKPAAVNPDTVEGYFISAGQMVPGVLMGKMKQGPAAQALFAKTGKAGGWTEAFTFNMAIGGKYEYTLKNGTLMIIIPKEYRKAGRTFALMGLDKNAKVVILNDTDTNPDTLTVKLNIEGYAFDLIYKD